MTSTNKIQGGRWAQRWTKAAPACAHALFFLQFTGYFLYHYLAAAGIIPVFVRGWFLMIAALSIVLLGVPLVLKRPGLGQQWVIHGAFSLFCAIVGSYAITYRFLGQEWQRSNELLFTSAAALISWVGLYLLGYWLRHNGRLKVIVLASLAIMAFLTLASIDPSTGVFIATARFGQQEGVGTYQGFALVFVPVAFLALALTRGWTPFVTLGVSAAVLVALASRSDTAGFLLIACVYATVILLRGQYQRAFASILAALAGPASLVGALFLINSVTLHPSQQQEVFRNLTEYREDGASISRYLAITDLSQSESMTQRREAFDMGWADIQSSPLFGVYGGQTRNGASAGLYIHSILSAWQQFGLAGFLVYLALSVAVPSIAIYQVLLRRSDDPLWHAVLYVGMFSLPLVIISKAVFWSLPALGWGLLAGRLSENVSDTGDRGGAFPAPASAGPKTVWRGEK